ncbi:MAG TPA: sulfite exporter TauE/SafE family protein [Syntrophomonadaceae bacterium]|nr:sulfite exporter TauE/SafE family protein [Syntrophomonadaceae bacterium]
MQGFLLGLASGTVCLAYCAPVLIPFILGEGKGIGRNYSLLARFLAGRLIGYLLFGLLAWAAGRLLIKNSIHQEIIFGLAYIILAVMMFYYGLSRPPEICAGKLMQKSGSRFLQRWPELLPVALGLATGLNLCPPFLLAFTGAADSASLVQSLLFFLAFFLGTSVYFLPMPLLGVFRRVAPLQTVGRMASVLMSLYYVYTGIIMLGGGIIGS